MAKKNSIGTHATRQHLPEYIYHCIFIAKFYSIMRPLTDEEIRVLFEKLELYVGPNLAKLIDRRDEPYTFRLVSDPTAAPTAVP
jgi:hypothetical protein